MARKATSQTTRKGTTRGAGKTERPARSPAGAPSQAGATTYQVPPHDRIEERARIIWEQRGRPQGQDIEIWTETEHQLLDEMKTGQKT